MRRKELWVVIAGMAIAAGMLLAKQPVEVKAASVANADDGQLVIMLDPGHDSTHAGAHSSDETGVLQEYDVNMKVARYAYEELSKYSGVKVYMTHYDVNCSAPEGSSLHDCLQYRADLTAEVGADLYVSMHQNSGSSTATGAEGIIPLPGYVDGASDVGHGVAQKILQHLNRLGIRLRSIYDRTNDSTYPDGSPEDYYGVIRMNKYNGIPAIIIEHAFLSNDDDVLSFLSTDEQLKEIGIADAEGIAEYYGLSKLKTVDGNPVSSNYRGFVMDDNGNLYYQKESETVDVSAIYDYDYYLSHNQDLAKAYGDNKVAVTRHFVKYGMKEGRQASSEFNPDVYLSNYSDLWYAFGNRKESSYLHYLNYGIDEERNAKDLLVYRYEGVNYSSVFDLETYKKNRRDVVKAYGDDDFKIFKHFVKYGMKEGSVASDNFDPVIYRNNYVDLNAAFGNDTVRYYKHYILYGRNEGRNASVQTTNYWKGTDYSDVFDAEYYAAHNPDVVKTLGSSRKALLGHFVNYGRAEGRKGKA